MLNLKLFNPKKTNTTWPPFFLSSLFCSLVSFFLLFQWFSGRKQITGAESFYFVLCPFKGNISETLIKQYPSPETFYGPSPIFQNRPRNLSATFRRRIRPHAILEMGTQPCLTFSCNIGYRYRCS